MRLPVSLVLAAVLLSGAGAAQAGALKPGLWEVHPVSHVVDGRDMTAMMKAAQEKMAAMMSKLPPEQREKMGNGMTATVCITPEMAADGVTPSGSGQDCERAKTTTAGNKVAFEFKCVAGDRTTVGKGENTIDGDIVHSRVEMTTTSPKGTTVTKAESELKWLKADCGAQKPKP